MPQQPAQPQQPTTPVVLSPQVTQVVQKHVNDSWGTYGTGISAFSASSMARP